MAVDRLHEPARSPPIGTCAATGTLSYDVDPALDELPEQVRRRKEYREAGDLGGELIGELTGLVQGVHSAIAKRVFRYVGAPAAPVLLVHFTVANGVYGAVKAGGNGIAKAAGYLLGRRDAPAISARRPGTSCWAPLTGCSAENWTSGTAR
ncbi:MAG TPA: hypothetical protein VLR26_00675 [Frankiaceae bacterium]|nr:hypothetical protein [Frankiaceae bacterium]